MKVLDFGLAKAVGPPEGEGVSETLARVLEREPDWSRLPSTLAPALRTYLQRCLQKDPRQRIRDIGDVRLALDGAFETATPPTTTAAAAPASPRRTVAMVSAALLAGAVVATLATWALMRPTPVPLQPMRFALSPDGRWVGYFAGTELRKVAIAGGPPVSLCQIAGNPRGASWGPDDTIVFATSDPTTGLFRVPAAGGTPTVLTTADAAQGEGDGRRPQLAGRAEGEARDRDSRRVGSAPRTLSNAIMPGCRACHSWRCCFSSSPRPTPANCGSPSPTSAACRCRAASSSPARPTSFATSS